MGEYPGDEAAMAAGVDTIGGVAVEGLLTPLAHQYVRETRPWIRFIAVVVFAVTGLMVVAGGIMVLIGLVSAVLPNAGEATGGVGAVSALMGLLYLAFAGLYVAIGVILVRYARALQRLEAGADVASLEAVLRWQKSFWRLVGIVTIAGIVATLLALLIGVVLGLMSGPYRA